MAEFGAKVLEGCVDLLGLLKLLKESKHAHKLLVSLGRVCAGKKCRKNELEAKKIVEELSQANVVGCGNFQCVMDPRTGKAKKGVSLCEMGKAGENAVRDWSNAHLVLSAVVTLSVVVSMRKLYNLDKDTTVNKKNAKFFLDSAHTCLLEDVLPNLNADSTDADLREAKNGLKHVNNYTKIAWNALETAETAASDYSFWGTAFAVAGTVGACIFAPFAATGAVAFSAGEAVGWVVGAQALTGLFSAGLSYSGFRGVTRSIEHKADLEKLRKALEEHNEHLQDVERLYYRSVPGVEHRPNPPA